MRLLISNMAISLLMSFFQESRFSVLYLVINTKAISKFIYSTFQNNNGDLFGINSDWPSIS